MGIIDKLKGTPKWKNADPAVRLEGLREADDPNVFAEVLDTDADAKVRQVWVDGVPFDTQPPKSPVGADAKKLTSKTPPSPAEKKSETPHVVSYEGKDDTKKADPAKKKAEFTALQKQRIAQPPFERRVFHDRRRARAAIARDRDLRRLVHRVGRRQTQPHPLIQRQCARRRGLVVRAGGRAADRASAERWLRRRGRSRGSPARARLVRRRRAGGGGGTGSTYAYRVLGQSAPSAVTETDLYTVPATTSTALNVTTEWSSVSPVGNPFCVPTIDNVTGADEVFGLVLKNNETEFKNNPFG